MLSRQRVKNSDDDDEDQRRNATGEHERSCEYVKSQGIRIKIA